MLGANSERHPRFLLLGGCPSPGSGLRGRCAEYSVAQPDPRQLLDLFLGLQFAAWISSWWQFHARDSSLEDIFWFLSSASPSSQPRDEPILSANQMPLSPRSHPVRAALILPPLTLFITITLTLLIYFLFWHQPECFQGRRAHYFCRPQFHFWAALVVEKSPPYNFPLRSQICP